MRFFSAAEADDPVDTLMEELAKKTVQVERVLGLNKTPDLERAFDTLVECRGSVERACANTAGISPTSAA